MTTVEAVSVILLALAAGGAALSSGWIRSPFGWLLAIVCVGLPGALWLVWSPAEPSIAQQLAPPKTENQGYVSSDKCRACHPAQHASWSRSYHSTMTQVADLDRIEAPLQPTFIEGGTDPFSRFFAMEIRDGAMWVDDVDFVAVSDAVKESGRIPARLPRMMGPVALMTGSHHIQIYWLRDERGVLRQVSWVWLIRDRRWVPTEDVYLQPQDGTLGMAGRWADNCIKCHSTGGQPGLPAAHAADDVASTRVGELGIACESCHGPASRHVAANQSPVRRYGLHLDDEPDPTIVNPSKLAPRLSVDVCARCHSGHRHESWDEQTGTPFKAGDPMARHFTIRRFDRLPAGVRGYYFWNDGTSRVTGREFNAMSVSGCFTRGDLTCLSCHSMHQSDPNDQLAAGKEGNGACLGCHESFSDRIAEHTHHPPGSSGSECMNCHMPNTTYGLLSITRSHRIDSPRLATPFEGGRPNACNLCHIDRSLAWTGAWLDEWYGQPPPPLTDDESSLAASALWLLRGDAVQRATAAWHLGWEPALAVGGDDWQGALLARSLADPYRAVRYLAHRSLTALPGYVNLDFDFTLAPAEQNDSVARALEVAERASGPRDLPRPLVERLLSERNDEVRMILE